VKWSCYLEGTFRQEEASNFRFAIRAPVPQRGYGATIHSSIRARTGAYTNCSLVLAGVGKGKEAPESPDRFTGSDATEVIARFSRASLDLEPATSTS